MPDYKKMWEEQYDNNQFLYEQLVERTDQLEEVKANLSGLLSNRQKEVLRKTHYDAETNKPKGLMPFVAKDDWKILPNGDKAHPITGATKPKLGVYFMVYFGTFVLDHRKDVWYRETWSEEQEARFKAYCEWCYDISWGYLNSLTQEKGDD